MNRQAFTFNQILTEEDLNTLQDNIESSDQKIMADLTASTITGGLTVRTSAPYNALIDPGTCVNVSGIRIEIPELQTINIQSYIPSNNKRYLSIALKNKRLLTNQRIDEYGNPYFYNSTESFEVVVVQGDIAAAPTPPTLSQDQVLLADMLLTSGISSVTDSMLDFSRVIRLSRYNYKLPAMLKAAARSATVILASSDSDTLSKINADRIIPTADDAALVLNFYSGKHIILMEGTYNLKTRFTPGNNTYIEGQGDSVILNRADNIDYMIYADTRTNITIANLGIEGQGALYASSLSAIYFKNVTGSKIRNLFIGNNTNEAGIKLEGIQKTIITGCYMANNAYGIRLLASSRNNVIHGNIIFNSAYRHIDLLNSKENVIANNVLSTGENGIYLSGSGDNNITGNIIMNNTGSGYGAGSGIIVILSDGNILSGNNIKTNNYTGIYLDRSNYSVINYNSFYQNTKDGIYLTASTNNTLTANNISSSVSGITLVNSSNYNVVSSNVTKSGAGSLINDTSSGNVLTGNK